MPTIRLTANSFALELIQRQHQEQSGGSLVGAPHERLGARIPSAAKAGLSGGAWWHD
jgi:hypothetical protein